MKRKFTDMNSNSDSDDLNNFQSQRTRKRPRRQKICISPLQSESDNDIIINNNDPSSKHINNNSQSSASLSLSDENININISKTHKKHTWSCEMCTYENNNNFTKCEMCDSKRTNTYNNNNIIHNNHSDTENETDTCASSDEILNDIKNEDNNFKNVISTKKLRKPKIKKQISIVDLTQNETEIIHKSKQTKLKLIPKHKNKNKNKNKNKKQKQKQEPKISCINGNRSRLKRNKKIKINKPKQKKKINKPKIQKHKLTKTESIESIDETELLLNSKNKNKNKNKNIEHISDDDCIIIGNKKIAKRKKKKNINNGHVKFILDNKTNKNQLQSEQWIDKYKPHHIDDLYLHSKKLAEMDKFFSNAFKSLDNLSYNKLQRLNDIKSTLFVVGQSGIGKTSCIECLCTKYNAKLLCYPNEDSNVKIYNQTIWDNNQTHFMTFSEQNRARNSIDIREQSQMNKLDAFLNRSKRFGSLNLIGGNNNKNKNKNVSVNKRQVILIRELPYVGRDEYLYKFREIILKCVNSTRNILIFEITTEFEGTRDDLQIFGSDIRYHSRVCTIRFNPINKTLMKKCLNNILINENLKKSIINANILIDDIIQNEKGDLRNGIQTLQMRLVQLSYNGQINMDKCNKKKGKNKYKNKKKKSQISSLKSVNVGGKEETLSLFHSLGKILYAKKDIEPEKAIEKSDIDCIMFNDLLYENFGDYFIYNIHFMNDNNNKNKNKNKTKELDEFGFEMDMFDDAIMSSENDNLFEKYYQTLNYFSDADICCEFYNKLRYNDTSTDLRSNINHVQFGSQLYPSLYSASIASRGYLISHDKQPKLKLPNNNNSYKKCGGLNAIRGSTHKLINNLKKELCQSFNDIILPKKRGYINNNEHYINDNELGLMRSFMCYPTSLYVDIFPLVSNIKNKSIEKECGMDQLCVSLIKNSNYYSEKYEWKTFHASRFDYIQKSIKYNNNNNNNMESDDDDKELIDEIEEVDDSF